MIGSAWHRVTGKEVSVHEVGDDYLIIEHPESHKLVRAKKELYTNSPRAAPSVQQRQGSRRYIVPSDPAPPPALLPAPAPAPAGPKLRDLVCPACESSGSARPSDNAKYPLLCRDCGTVGSLADFGWSPPETRGHFRPLGVKSVAPPRDTRAFGRYTPPVRPEITPEMLAEGRLRTELHQREQERKAGRAREREETHPEDRARERERERDLAHVRNLANAQWKRGGR